MYLNLSSQKRFIDCSEMLPPKTKQQTTVLLSMRRSSGWSKMRDGIWKGVCCHWVSWRPSFQEKCPNFPSNFTCAEKRDECSPHQHHCNWKHIFGSMQLINCQREVRGKHEAGTGGEPSETRCCLHRTTVNLLVRGVNTRW